MIKYLWAPGLLGLVICNGHACASGVAMQHFDAGVSPEAQDGFVLRAASRDPSPAAKPIVPVSGEQTVAEHSQRPSVNLASEFEALGAQERHRSAQHLADDSNEITGKVIPVPAWMKSVVTGRPVRLAGPFTWRPPVRAQVLPMASLAGCDVEPYRRNPGISRLAEQRRAYFYEAMVQAACAAGVPVSLFDAMITQESGYNPVAISPKGAVGLGQLMPSTARRLGVWNVADPIANLRGSALELKLLLSQFGRFDLALAAYNAGPNRVKTTWQVPRIRETMHYVTNILVTMRDQIARRVFSNSGMGIEVAETSPAVRHAAYLSFNSN